MEESTVKQLDAIEAIEFAKSGVWKNWTHQQITGFQLYQENLCMPFEVFHEAIEKTLGRPVYTHEFGMNYDGLVAEYLGLCEKPSLEEIIKMLPNDKCFLKKNLLFCWRNNHD